jgi:hypothetical protein
VKKLLIIALLLIPSTASAEEWFTWDDANTQFHVALTTLFIIDLGQSIYASDNLWTRETGRHENNQILGKYPSNGDVYTYFAASYALTTFVTYALPEKWSHAFQGGVIMLQLHVINDNYMAGVGFKF